MKSESISEYSISFHAAINLYERKLICVAFDNVPKELSSQETKGYEKNISSIYV